MAVCRTYTNSSPLQIVLVVADDPEKASLWRQLFGDKGYNVVIENIAQAADTARSLNPQLVLVDLDLSHVEQLALYHGLKVASQAALLTIIQLRPLEIVETYAAGVDECLIQPINPALVLVKAMAWMVRQQIPNALRVVVGTLL